MRSLFFTFLILTVTFCYSHQVTSYEFLILYERDTDDSPSLNDSVEVFKKHFQLDEKAFFDFILDYIDNLQDEDPMFKQKLTRSLLVLGYLNMEESSDVLGSYVLDDGKNKGDSSVVFHALIAYLNNNPEPVDLVISAVLNSDTHKNLRLDVYSYWKSIAASGKTKSISDQFEVLLEEYRETESADG